MRRLLGLALAFALGPACVHAPPQLSPEAKVTFQMNRVFIGIEALQSLAIDAEAAGVISEDDARVVVKATVDAAKYGRVLAAALQAGYTEADVQRKTVLKLRAVLQAVPAALSPKAYDLVNPYVQAVLAALSLWGA